MSSVVCHPCIYNIVDADTDADTIHPLDYSVSPVNSPQISNNKSPHPRQTSELSRTTTNSQNTSTTAASLSSDSESEDEYGYTWSKPHSGLYLLIFV